MHVVAASSTTPDVVIAVVAFSLVAAATCLGLAVYFAFADKPATDALRAAAKDAGSKTSARLANPAAEQSGPIDFGGLAQLATALDTLNRSGRFQVGAFAFAAIAAVAAGTAAVAA